MIPFREHGELGQLGVGCIAPPDVKVYLSCVQAIFFCPWCGRRLARYYVRSADRLVDAELCREFQVPGWKQVADAEPDAAPGEA